VRADRIAPATWLLGAAAAWAVLGAALAWAGMGGRVAAADGDAIAAQPLPQPVADAKDIAPAPFDAFAARPPFAQDRLPHPFSLPGGDNDGARGDASAFDYALSSVIITPRLRMAIVQPAQGGDPVRVREGETAEGLGGWRLVELRPRAAVFEGPGGRRELELRVWAGGGDAAMSSADAPDAPEPVPPPEPAPARVPVGQPARPLSAQTASPVVDAPPPSAAPAPTQVTQQMEAIRRRIEARRAQLRREAQQSRGTQSQNAQSQNTQPQNTQSQDTPQAAPARDP
jgi:general secretion pathway protein N